MDTGQILLIVGAVVLGGSILACVVAAAVHPETRPQMAVVGLQLARVLVIWLQTPRRVMRGIRGRTLRSSGNQD